MTDKRAKELFGHYPDKLLKAFRAYHDANPEIYKRFVKLAKQMRSTGRKHYSSKMIINVIRWETDLRGSDEFKINDRYQSLYGRLMVYNYPEYEDFFQFRYRKEYK